MKNFNKIFNNPKTLEDLIFSSKRFFYLNPKDKKTKFFQKNFLKFYRKFIKKKQVIIPLNKFEKLYFPFIKMGNLDSIGMFAYHEHNVFLFYFINRFKYTKVADIGANIGLHSLLLSKFGYKIDAYEPDPDHCKILKRYILKNKCKNIKIIKKAVFNKNSKLEFTKVLGNTAANHISGEKDVVYGKLKKIKINAIDIKKIIKKYDLIKMDAEGSEGKIIASLNKKQLKKTDIICEISGKANAKKIFDHCKKNKILIFSHKISWKAVSSLNQMPIHHTEGLIFITSKSNLLDFVK
jgi:FkbM family methyltransferase